MNIEFIWIYLVSWSKKILFFTRRHSFSIYIIKLMAVAIRKNIRRPNVARKNIHAKKRSDKRLRRSQATNECEEVKEWRYECEGEKCTISPSPSQLCFLAFKTPPLIRNFTPSCSGGRRERAINLALTKHDRY